MKILRKFSFVLFFIQKPLNALFNAKTFGLKILEIFISIRTKTPEICDIGGKGGGFKRMLRNANFIALLYHDFEKRP